jgi:hypothetical protein
MGSQRSSRLLTCLLFLSALNVSRLAAAQTPPAEPAVPIVNRVNELLPSWLNVRGEFRERMEGFSGANYVADREDLYYLSRFRFNATIKPNPQLSLQVQMQDARVGRKTVGPTGFPFKAPIDVRMAFADIGKPTGRVSLRAGRQEFVFGEQRLLGHVSWLNAARTWDAARVTVRAKTFQVDALAGSVVRIMDGEFDKSGNGNRFAGLYGSTTKLIPKSTVEPYVLYRADRNLRTEGGAFGHLSQTTVGARWAGTLPAAFEYGVETAFQIGSLGADSVGAWAGHYQIKTPAGPRAVRFVSEYNYASGDSSPADGKRGAFDNLYPTPHDKYGLADQVGWRNIHHLRQGIELTPAKGWPMLVNFHAWWLAERKDGLYTAGSALVARIPTGAPNRHVGEELDIQISRAVSPQLQLAAGFAHIFPGSFLKTATPGASYSHAYVMATYAFLAEK